jgi:hypothetical protein
MSGYDIFLSDGDLLTTVNVKTVDVQQNSSLYLIGQGIPDYGTMVAQDFVWMLEHFSKSTPPVHPLIGQVWHNSVTDRLNFYDNSGDWQALATDQTSSSTQFVMLSAATHIDFTTVHSVVIFTAPDATKTYCPSLLILVPNGTPVASVGPTINLTASTTGDVIASTALTVGTVDQFHRITTLSMPRAATAAHPSITLNITVAATGGALHMDAYIFGFTV